MKMKTLKEGIITHADSLGELFKFSAEHTCRSMLHSLEGFANMELVTFRELTAGFFLGFEHNLWASGCSRNTSACYFRALRAICKEAERQGMLKDAKQLFSEVFMGYEETRKRALSIEQLRMVADADLEDTPSLGVARDLFILSYYLRGIPFIDLAYLRKTDIHDDVLRYRRSKTGRVLTITLEPWMWEIIERYLCDDSGSPYLLRIIRQSGSIPEERKQYESALRLYNKHLYRLSERLGLGVRLTSYVARHTWATLAYNEDIPVAKISAGLSHASEEITHTYLRSFSDEQLAVVNLQMAALVNPMAEKEWKRKEKGNYKVRKNSQNELHISVTIPGRKRNDSGGKGTNSKRNNQGKQEILIEVSQFSVKNQLNYNTRHDKNISLILKVRFCLKKSCQ